jgi:hypothetical protein
MRRSKEGKGLEESEKKKNLRLSCLIKRKIGTG